MKRRDEITFEWELEPAGHGVLPTRSPESLIRSEADAAIANALARSTSSSITVDVRVEDSPVTTTGQVEWNCQRELAQRAVETVTGDTAVFTGYVRSLAEKKQASLATWGSPDGTRVENRLAVRRRPLRALAAAQVKRPNRGAPG